jgi:hypothetical protein
MKPQTTLRVALADPKLLANALSGESWAAWRSLLLAAMGEPLEATELEHFRRLTGRQVPPPERVDELWCVIGRRGGKSRAIAVLAAYLAALCRVKLDPGEIGVVLCLAPSKEQAGVVLSYVAAALEQSPILSRLIRRQTSESIELTNRITIDVRSASFRRLRGQTCVACIADEAAYWQSEESSNPDTEIINAVRPSLLTTHGPLIVISSPYSRKGALWTAYRENFRPDGDVKILIAQGASRDLNPTLPQRDIDRAFEKDPAMAAAEYGAQFRSDIEGYVSIEAVAACIDRGVLERPFDRRWAYSAFTDPSGGVTDSFTIAIAHKEGKSSVLDAVRELRPPFSPEAAVVEFCALLRAYRITSVTGDRDGGEWPREQFRLGGITYEPSERSKSELYQELLPLLNSRTAGLLDNATLQRQLIGLERRTGRSGKDSIDHGPGGRDDVANSVAGALVGAATAVDPAVMASFDRDLRYPAAGIA